MISLHAWSQDKADANSANNTPEPTEMPAPSPVKRQSLPTNLDKELHRLLGDELKDENLVKLVADGEEFFGVWKHTILANALGAVLILHEEGQNVDWPLTVNSLRVELAEHGWSTLAVALPNPHGEKILVRAIPTPASAPNPEPGTSTEDEANTAAEQATLPTDAPKEIAETATPEPSPPPPKADIEAQVHARLDAAINYLHKVGQFNIVVVGQGIGAVRATAFIKRLMTSAANKQMTKNAAKTKAIIKRPIRALVLVNARNHIAGSPVKLYEQLKDPGLPVLDILFGEHHLDSFEAKKRREWASRNQLKNYSQVKMRRPVGPASEHNNRLVKRVRGFLNRNAKGVEIGK